MSTQTNSLKITTGYANSEKSRQYTFSGISTGSLSSIETKIIDINASLAATTDGGMSSFFVDDDGNNLVSITSATITQVIEEDII